MIGLIAVGRALIRSLKRLAEDPESRGLLSLVAALVAGGTIFYRQAEELSWLDSCYFTIVTLTTVGYGDIAPTTTAGKLFTMAYLLIGVGLLVALATRVANSMVEARRDSIDQRRERRKS